MEEQKQRIKGLWPWFWTWRRPSSVSASLWSLPKKDLAGTLCGYSEHQRRVQFEGCAAEPLTTIAAILPGSKWSCLLLRIVLQDALSAVAKIYPSLKLRVSVDDIAALVEGRNKEVAEMGKKVMKKLREEAEKKGHKLSVTENGKEGKSKMLASCGFLESELSQNSKEEGVAGSMDRDIGVTSRKKLG